jgi:L-alanine-DL-glutamate epimerase-like enolase superfamily enzyme
VVAARCARYALPSGGPVDGPRVGAWIALEHAAGWRAAGELTAWPGFSLTLDETYPILERFALSLGGNSIAHGLASLDPTLPSPVRFALETALLSLEAAVANASLAEVLGRYLQAPIASSVEVNALVDGVDAALRARGEGFGTFKVKANGPRDLPKLADVRGALGPDVALRCDLNGRVGRAQAAEFLEAAAALRLEYVEDPLDAESVAEWRALRGLGAPLAIDRLASKKKFCDELLEQKVARVLVLKPAFDGGIFAAASRARDWIRRGGEVVLTGALESAVGRGAVGHLACALSLPAAMGLTSPTRDGLPEPVRGGRFEPRSAREMPCPLSS